MSSYQNGLVYSVIANNATTLANAQAAQKAALNSFLGTTSNTNAVVWSTAVYAGSTLGYLCLSICTSVNTSTPSAQVYNNTFQNYWTVLVAQATTVATFITNLTTALNGVTNSFNNAMPPINNFELLWDGTNITGIVYSNYYEMLT